MAITNGYATQREFLDEVALLTGYNPHVIDDAVIDGFITDASRLVDAACAGRWFYSASETRKYDVPVPAPGATRQLLLDADLLTITTLTNGDATVIASADYILLPANAPSKYAIRIKPSATIAWEPDTNGNLEQVISVVGTWGYVNRSLTDPKSVEIVRNTHRACLSIAKSLYQKRFGQGVEGVAQMTPAGVVITPQGIPRDAWEAIKGYAKQGGALA